MTLTYGCASRARAHAQAVTAGNGLARTCRCVAMRMKPRIATHVRPTGRVAFSAPSHQARAAAITVWAGGIRPVEASHPSMATVAIEAADEDRALKGIGFLRAPDLRSNESLARNRLLSAALGNLQTLRGMQRTPWGASSVSKIGAISAPDVGEVKPATTIRGQPRLLVAVAPHFRKTCRFGTAIHLHRQPFWAHAWTGRLSKCKRSCVWP